MKQVQKSYVYRLIIAFVLASAALTMTASMESILHTTISVHRYLMGGITLVVFFMTGSAVYHCWRASTIDVLYTMRKIGALVLAIFPIYVFIFQAALCWMWLF